MFTYKPMFMMWSVISVLKIIALSTIFFLTLNIQKYQIGLDSL